MHILVVEDEVALCDTIVRSLKRLAYSVDYCYDGQKALDIFCQWSCFKVAKKFCLSSRECTAQQFGRYENKRRCFA